MKEKINKEFWYVLKKIKMEFLRTKSGQPIDYWINPGFVDLTGEIPSAKNQIKILEKLEESEAIKILNPGGTGEYE